MFVSEIGSIIIYPVPTYDRILNKHDPGRSLVHSLFALTVR